MFQYSPTLLQKYSKLRMILKSLTIFVFKCCYITKHLTLRTDTNKPTLTIFGFWCWLLFKV